MQPSYLKQQMSNISETVLIFQLSFAYVHRRVHLISHYTDAERHQMLFPSVVLALDSS